MADDPLGNLGDLTKPATVLVEKISDAVGGLFKPWQIVRVANAGEKKFSTKLRGWQLIYSNQP